MTNPEFIGLLGLMFLAASCANPCALSNVLSAYEAESLQCVRLSATHSLALECFEEVDERYLPRLKRLGYENAKELRRAIENVSDLD